MLGFLLVTSYSSQALTTRTSNVIHGNAPYLTLDGGRTRVTDTDGLLGISLSNGERHTPSTNYSSTAEPIVLPIRGQSFADISMFIPVNTDAVDLRTLILSPYNYWGDDDGDGDITATGSLSLSIVDRNKQAVSRNTVPEVCKAPYQVKLTSTNGTLTTRYGVPSSRNFSASNVTYYISPMSSPVICFARPDMLYSSGKYAGPPTIWDPYNGFLPQSSYDLNFPTTGLHGLYFDLDIRGIRKALYWEPVSRGGITATMTNSSTESVRVTLTGPVATSSLHSSRNPGLISKPTLPQTFELIGRDSRGDTVVKYGFTIKQWFVNRGSKSDFYSNTLSWCNSIGYRMSRVKDLTNALRTDAVVSGALPASSGNWYQRHIGAGFFTEWGALSHSSEVGFYYHWYWTSDSKGSYQFLVGPNDGAVDWGSNSRYGLCTYP